LRDSKTTRWARKRHGQTIALGIEKVEIADVIETPAGPAYQNAVEILETP
jgi:uncharacterized membrane protein